MMVTDVVMYSSFSEGTQTTAESTAFCIVNDLNGASCGTSFAGGVVDDDDVGTEANSCDDYDQDEEDMYPFLSPSAVPSSKCRKMVKLPQMIPQCPSLDSEDSASSFLNLADDVEESDRFETDDMESVVSTIERRRSIELSVCDRSIDSEKDEKIKPRVRFSSRPPGIIPPIQLYDISDNGEGDANTYGDELYRSSLHTFESISSKDTEYDTTKGRGGRKEHPLWFSGRDLKHAQLTARKQASMFTKPKNHEGIKYAEHFRQLYQDCIKAKTMEDLMIRAGENNLNAIHILTTNALAIRGLELRLLSEEESSVLRRKVHLQTILLLQDKLRKASAVVAEATKQQPVACNHDELLRSWSVQSSRPARLLGRILAHADAFHVATMKREEMLQRLERS